MLFPLKDCLASEPSPTRAGAKAAERPDDVLTAAASNVCA